MKFYSTLQILIGFRGTKKQIQREIYRLTKRHTILHKSDEQLEGNDTCYQAFLGIDCDDYLDFDIYLIKTRAESETGKPVWYITEINQSY